MSTDPALDTQAAADDTQTTVESVRLELLTASWQAYLHRKPYSAKMRARTATPADFDAYEALVASGTNAYMLAALLRVLAGMPGDGPALADRFAGRVHGVLEDSLEDGWEENADLEERAAAAAGALHCQDCQGTGLNIGRPGLCPSCDGTPTVSVFEACGGASA